MLTQRDEVRNCIFFKNYFFETLKATLYASLAFFVFTYGVTDQINLAINISLFFPVFFLIFTVSFFYRDLYYGDCAKIELGAKGITYKKLEFKTYFLPYESLSLVYYESQFNAGFTIYNFVHQLKDNEIEISLCDFHSDCRALLKIAKSNEISFQPATSLD